MSNMLKTAGTIREIERLRAINAELLAALEAVAANFAKVKPGHGYYANTLAIKLMPAVQGAIAKAKG